MRTISISAILVLLTLLLVACTSDYEVENEPQLVVEGWIDNEGYPVVMLTTTVSVTEERQQLSDLGNYILKWAKVTVSDGEQEVVLTGKVDRQYFPPYIYTTSRIQGKTGKSYRLTVDYEQFHAEATTTIPESSELDSIRVRPCELTDTLYEIQAYFHDDMQEPRYYKFFTLTGTNSRLFLSSYMQTLSNQVFATNQEQCVSVYKGRLVTAPSSYIPYFTASDSVVVKFARIDYESFLFWNEMERNATLGGSPITSVHTNPSFNVKGALGYWCGYGASLYPVSIGDSIRAAAWKH